MEKTIKNTKQSKKEPKDLSLNDFKILIDTKFYHIHYDTDLPEYQKQTIDSVIKEVLTQKKISTLPIKNEQINSNNYQLICPCGYAFDSSTLLINAKCLHPNIDKSYKNKKIENKYLLIEKLKSENLPILTNDDISNILQKVTNAKEKIILKGIAINKKIKFKISENLKNKFKELSIKRSKAKELEEEGFPIKYNEEKLKRMIEQIGCDEMKSIASLRFVNNNLEEAIVLASGEEFNLPEYLKIKNNEVLTKIEYDKFCEELVKNEYPDLKERDEIKKRVKNIYKIINKKGRESEEYSDDSDDSEREERLMYGEELSDSNDDSLGLDADL